MRLIASVILLLVLGTRAVVAQAADPDAPIIAGKAALPGLQLALLAPKTQCEQGEPVLVTMRYTYNGLRPLSVLVVNGDRSGRVQDFGFTAVDDDGRSVADPIPVLGMFGGGGRGADVLTPGRPYVQKATLNEWLRFDHPGRYRVTAHSSIIHFNDDHEEFPTGPPIPLDSAPLLVTISPPDDAHRRARLARDQTGLGSRNQETRLGALRDLRFMVDVRAIPALVQGLSDESTNASYEAWFGLQAFPDMAPVQAALLAAVQTPGHPIPPDKRFFFVNLLTQADLRKQGKTPGMFSPDARRASAKYEALLATCEKADLKTLPPGKAAEQTVVGLAVGPLSRTDLKNWKRVFDNARLMSRESQSYAGSLLGGESDDLREIFPNVRILRPLIPELRRMAADSHLSGDLRSGAFVTLHAIGDDTERDLVMSDLTSPAPHLSTSAHATLGVYRSAEIGAALVRLMTFPDDDVQQSAAARLRDIGSAVPASKISALLRRDVSGNLQTHEALLEALALQSPSAALPFLAAEIRKRDRTYSGVSDTPIRLLCRMNSMAARTLVGQVFASPDFHQRETVAQALGQAYEEAEHPEQSGFMRAERHLPPNAPFAASFFPRLLALARADPSGEVRRSARQSLATISGIPRNGMGVTTKAQNAAWLPQWQAWWEKNRAVYGHGVATPVRGT